VSDRKIDETMIFSFINIHREQFQLRMAST
jgi:hypothetical protein